MKQDQSEKPESDEFAKLASQGRTSVMREFWDFLRHEKKWWLTPIILILLILGLLVMAGPAAAPFIYPFF